MKKLIAILIIALSASFAADTNWQIHNVAGKAKRTIPLALGAALSTTITGGASITLDVVATTGRSNLPQIMTLTNLGVAISTIDVIVLDDVAIGDVLLLQTNRASEDVVVIDDGSTIYLGAASRTLSGPSDVLMLQKFSATAVREISFTDNE